VSGALDPHRLAEYRRKLRDPRYLAHALAQVASVLVDMLALADHRAVRGSNHNGGSWRANGCNGCAR